MTTAILGIGLPGSGKTTYLKSIAMKRPNSVYISADEIREQITGNPLDQTENSLVWELLYDAVALALSQGKDVIVDSTNYRQSDRRKLVSHCAKFTPKIIGIVMNAHIDECKRRNALRQNAVPEYVIDRMFNEFLKNPPSDQDGFELIIDINIELIFKGKEPQ